jgi:hypothetical protein
MEVVNVSYLGSDGQYQTYAPSDTSLINTSLITANFGTPNDYIEYFIKDQSGVVLSSNYYVTDYNIGDNIDSVTNTTSVLELDPETDARVSGYNRGIVNVKYNFLTKWLSSAPDPINNFWIKEISTSRTEIKAARQDLSNTELANAFGTFNAALTADAYYPDFYLNFGADALVIGVNAVYIEENGSGYVIFKLYEPLPDQFDLKSTFWVVTEAANPAEFNVSINITPETVLDYTQLQGPNFKVHVKDKVGQTTPYYNYTSLLLTSVASSYQQLQSMMQEQGIDINVDYSNFSNFIHFSSITDRLYNFNYKIQLIESASAGIAAGQTTTGAALLQQQIDSIITNFDGYEYYLYFTSESTAWPKQNGSIPYALYSATSSQATNWLGNLQTAPNGPATMSMYWSSSRYDDQNQDLLLYTAPSYIAEDPSNQPYFLFLNMVGQMFDNIWIYLKDVTNLYAANNNPFKGISLEEVADAIRNMGVQLYTNTSISDNIYYSLLGINQTGSALLPTSNLYSTIVYSSSSLYPLGTGTDSPEAYLTASLSLPPFGEELINRFVTTFITGSANVTSSFATLPNSQITAEIYKRIYHNMPYLLKTRGTRRGVQALITCFGVPEDILTVHEYGGYNIYNVAGIQEISNTKILTGSVLTISSSLLSPFTTIQYYQNNQDKSSDDLEIGFSPADSINASITSSGYVTSSTEPGYFNIMQLIGAPALQYSSSYTPLVNLANTYFDAEYTSGYNVWDFIRVIKYYNNSLFKMLRDWVPARTSTSTGIIIQSHMLERNKYPRNEPTFTNLSGSVQIKMVSISGSDGGAINKNTYYVEKIPVQYQSNSVYLRNAPGIIYMSSSNNIQKYNGEFSGSTIQASYNYFSQKEVSSYVYPWTSSIPAGFGPCDVQTPVMFLTYSLSPTLNNITGSVVSQRFLELDYNSAQLVATNYGLVTQSLARTLVIGNISQSMAPYSQYAQIQDYNYNLPSTVSIRYSGSYLQGAQYNTWSVGDISYGNQPVINYYSDKLGLFTQIQSSSFFPGAVNASIAYLADVSGGLSELNQNNKHWVDIQNTFVRGTTLTVKQFDNKKYSNQVATDGVKTIINSGYNYTPELYFKSGSDTKVYFQFLGAITGENLLVQNIGTATNPAATQNLFISGAVSNAPSYPMNVGISSGVGKATGFIYNIFNNIVTDTAGFYTPGNASTYTFPTFIDPFAGSRVFNTAFSIAVEFPVTAQQVTYNFSVARNGVTVPDSTITQTFTSYQSQGGYSPGTINTYGNIAGTNFQLIQAGATVTGPFLVNGNLVGNTNSFMYWGAYNYTTGFGYPGSGNFASLISSDLAPYIIPVGANPPTPTQIGTPTSAGYNTPVDNLTATLDFNSSVTINCAPNDAISFRLQEVLNASSANYTASISIGSLAMAESILQGSYSYASSSYNGVGTPFISDINNQDQIGQITMSADITAFYGYQQVPYFVSGSPAGYSPVTSTYVYSSSLYSLYGDVNKPFIPQVNDAVVLKDIYGISQVVNVFSSSFAPDINAPSRQLVIHTTPSILSNWASDNSIVQYFLLLNRYNDEQNLIINYTKPPGQTSYGFLIPETINPSVLSNINTLQANVQAQLLSTQTAASTTQ